MLLKTISSGNPKWLPRPIMCSEILLVRNYSADGIVTL
jgi:hypothetical protein